MTISLPRVDFTKRKPTQNHIHDLMGNKHISETPLIRKGPNSSPVDPSNPAVPNDLFFHGS